MNYFSSGVRDIQSLQVKCSNDVGGCAWEGELREMEAHVTKCTTELITCKYSSVGCKVKVLKKNLTSHEEDCTTKHLKLAMERVESLTKRVQALEQKQQGALVNTPPVVFKMDRFTYHKNSRTLWESPPFFSHPRGYKIYLQVNTFGMDGRGQKTISVKVCLMHGCNDDNLVWPFKGTVIFHLMNQDSDVNHRLGRAKFLERRESEKNRRVSAAQGKSVAGWGVNDILVPTDPDFWCYVQSDCLYIRVSEVEVGLANRPWLLS